VKGGRNQNFPFPSRIQISGGDLMNGGMHDEMRLREGRIFPGKIRLRRRKEDLLSIPRPRRQLFKSVPGNRARLQRKTRCIERANIAPRGLWNFP